MASKPNGIRSSRKMASTASRVLRNKNTGSTSKKLAGGVLGNRAKKTK